MVTSARNIVIVLAAEHLSAKHYYTVCNTIIKVFATIWYTGITMNLGVGRFRMIVLYIFLASYNTELNTTYKHT